MNVLAEISLYPLRQNDLTRPIQEFIESLKADNLDVKTHSTSSIISGDSRLIFQGLQKAFNLAAEKYSVVLTAKISNACPHVPLE